MTRARLLLVEDNPVIRAELMEALGALFEVVAALETAEDALQWLRAHPQAWDVAVIDIFLRRGHGYQVLRECARRKPWQAAVVLSNYTREPARSSALQQGADAVFDKSFEMEAFLAYCATLADAGRKARGTRADASGMVAAG